MSSPAPLHPTREAWLNAFIEAARPTFAALAAPIPSAVRVSIGFTSKGARSKRIGECWSGVASADGTYEIFIVPGLDDASRIADILTHELCHTTAPGDGHGKLFKAHATGVGLGGKMTATIATPAWHEWADPIVEALGPLPHASLNSAYEGKKQTTRMLKCECHDCGLTFRATAKWAPLISKCPDDECGGFVSVEGWS